ncbi:MAG: hypothetical protein IKB01_04515 [Lachnospiraceae bacterium]|nr:hypothetical protein [Lachnospiraceae bacterium]MBR3684049.1 hypothetical protein [Lachnospiraceae bacterium]
MLYQISAIAILLAFYSFYIRKIIIQRKQSIKTNQMGMGNKEKRVLWNDKIMVVAHGGVIRRYTGVGLIKHCEVCEIDYTRDFECFGWV